MQFSDEREKFGQQNECVLRITKPHGIEFAKNQRPAGIKLFYAEQIMKLTFTSIEKRMRVEYTGSMIVMGLK